MLRPDGGGGAAVKTGLSVKGEDTTARICLFVSSPESSSGHFTLPEPDVLYSGFLADIASMARVHNVIVCLSCSGGPAGRREYSKCSLVTPPSDIPGHVISGSKRPKAMKDQSAAHDSTVSPSCTRCLSLVGFLKT